MISFSQNKLTYYLELKEGYELSTLQKTINSDETITISSNRNDFSILINSITTYEFKKAFPTSITPMLQRVYLLTMDADAQINDFFNRYDIEKFFLLEEEPILLTENSNSIFFPNDYEDIITGGNNASLDLIKAPLAWTITSGEPSILVGVADSKYEFDNPELIGQIIDDILIQNSNVPHGTAVTSIIAANTNNGIGISSLANKTKLITASCGGGAYNLINGLLELSKYPGVRVINCSWIVCDNTQSKGYLDGVIAEINSEATPDVLIVAGAGNGIKANGQPATSCDGGHGYAYPASYDSVISVTGVGQRFPIGTTALGDGIPGETNSWIDVHGTNLENGGTASLTHNDRVDVSAPGVYVLMATNNYEDHPTGYLAGIGTSASAPFVSALAALIFSVNPSLTADQVKDIIKTTADDIYYIPENQPYVGLLGTGRINAYRAVKKAKCMLSPEAGIDLAMQDSNVDGFVEPNTVTQQPWNSKDIWVRNQNDGLVMKVHQNPEYSTTNPNYVYVRVTNNSCQATTGTDSIKLYWAKANTALSWPAHWNGTLHLHDEETNQDILMGDEIATLTVPPLEIGQEAIIEFEWYIPNPLDFENINPNPWHFCLLARIDTPNDPMTFTEGEDITPNVLNNNNIAWKNTTVVDFVDDIQASIGGVVAVGNYFNQQKAFSLELVKEENEPGKSIYEEAEVTIEMDDILYNAWQEGGKLEQNTDSTKVASKRIITGNNAIFSNIILDPNEIGTLYLTFNFLTKELSNKTEYSYHLIQRDAVTNEIIGGETFEIRKKSRDAFTANAGNDAEIGKNETITITAGEINEDATYNWYDPEGNLIYTGTDLTLTPALTQTYKLEIISNIDGFKDYDEVEITVNPYKLESLVPNPATNQVTVNYIADEASSGYVMVVDMNTGNSDNYILDTQQSSTIIDVSTYTPGLYNMILICDGEVQNSKTLIKQ